jgi:hypothetical protein
VGARVRVRVLLATIGLVTRNPETAQFAAALPLFVLVFASSAFVPVPALPGWLQAFANARLHVDQAARALMQP